MAQSQPSAVRFYAPDAPQLARTLRGRLEAHRNDLVGQVADGCGSDWADYRYRVGMIAGLVWAIEECGIAEKALRDD